jgi:hypothetical protein
MYLFLFFAVNIDADAIEGVDADDACTCPDPELEIELELDDVLLPFTKKSLLSSYSSGNECVSGLLTMYNKWSLFKSLRYSSIVKFP